ncbi:MAG TPA: ABC transporter permease [Anaerolineae bacterium]|nr:ABC transporter permease [Anaerolineae bacterium]
MGLKRLGKGLLPLLLIACAWELLPRAEVVDPVLLPPLSEVMARGGELASSGVLVRHALASLRRVLLGFSLAAGVAIPLGIALGLSPSLEDYVDLTLQLLRPLSPPAWIPLAILWFGIGDPPAVFIIFVGTVFAMLVGTLAAARGVDKRLVKAGFTLGAGRREAIRLVVIPCLLPALFAQLRVGLGLAWMCVIAAEMVAVHRGIGFMMIEARNLFRTEDVLLGMMAVGAMGLGFDFLLRQVEGRILRWRKGVAAHELFEHQRPA